MFSVKCIVPELFPIQIAGGRISTTCDVEFNYMVTTREGKIIFKVQIRPFS